MPSFWKQIKSAFSAAEQSSPSQPAVHELLTQSVADELAFEQWKRTESGARLLDWLAEEYSIFRAKRPGDQALAFLDTPSSKGFIIYFHRMGYRTEEIRHFFYLLKERIQAFNYRVDLSDRRIYNRRDWVETVERHYLKPRNKFVPGELIDQRYGNIAISLESRDDQIHHLRLRATIYRDALYAKGQDFSDLMHQLGQTD
ncbi:MAG: hypothetical protein AAF433_10775 [Bacteroidota bacterium]